MRTVRFALAAAVALSLSAPAWSAPRPQESWGRAGVDFDTYRQDAVECASVAYYADVSGTEQAQAFVRGTKRLESIDGLPLDFLEMARNYGQIHDSVRPERQINELREAMQSVVDICLTQRGYVKFRLTEEQREELGHLRKGSDERHHYMHMLASDSTVLESQAVSEEKA